MLYLTRHIGWGMLAVLVAVSTGLAKEAEHWVRFGNARFGTIAEIPQGVFKSKHPPANGDGRSFLAEDGAEIRIYGSYNSEESFAAYKRWLRSVLTSEGVKLTYEAGGASWLAYSGLKAGNVIYYKQIEGCGAIHTVSATYPSNAKARYDPIVARVARSLRCMGPMDCRGGEQSCKLVVPEYNDGRWGPDDT